MNKTIYSEEHRYLVGRLKKAREEAGLNQKQVAKIIKKTQSCISKIESGQRRIDIAQLKEFSKIYNKKLDYFIKNS